MNWTFIRVIASLRLTVACLIAGILLVFLGTIAQVDLGLWEAQQKYFQSVLVFWNLRGSDLQIPVFPGGYLLGWILVINLIAAHWVRFKIAKKSFGIALTHLGVLLLLVGQFVTELVQIESAMRLAEGESASYSESVRHTELAIVESTGDEERVVVIPDSVLARKGEVRHPDLPFRILIKEWHENSEPRLIQSAGPDSTDSIPLAFHPLPPARRMDEANMPSARIAIVSDTGGEKQFDVSVFLANRHARESIVRWARTSLGYDIGDQLQNAHRLTHNGREFALSLRPTRFYKVSGKGAKPCVITLLDFRHDKYEGTATARNFSSRIRLSDPNTGQNREALISMNTPFRFGGETYYQGSFDPRNENVTILHVVRNPVWLSPYLACLLVGLGLSIHFVARLSSFVKRKPALAAKPIAETHSNAGRFGKASLFQKWFPGLLVALAGLWAATQIVPSKKQGGFDDFGKAPVLLNGRIQPIDSAARNALLAISGKSSLRDERGDEIAPVEWMLELMTRSALADDRKIFRLENLEFRALLNNREGRLGFVSLNEIRPHLDRIEKEARQIQAHKEPSQRTGYERDLMHLYESLLLYQRIEGTLLPNSPAFAANFELALEQFQSFLPAMLEGVRNYQISQENAADGVELAADYFRQFREMATLGYALCVPLSATNAPQRWSTVGEALLGAFRTGRLPESLSHLGRIVSAYQKRDETAFRTMLAEYLSWLNAAGFASDATQASRETFFNRASFFYKALLLYLGAALFGCVYWFRCSEPLRRAAVRLLVIALALHSAGLIFRMVLHGRPPVTNLYSSAVFVGWGSVLLGLFLERMHRTGMGVVVSGLVGFVTLIVAHHLGSAGDTLHVLQAVLDTNIWLATHVVIVSTGYAAMFLAGAFAASAIIRKQLDRSFTQAAEKTVAATVFGVTCFATLFSFVGTVLGGIWADQSWGRFWGWDPKENGALMIVMWCAVVLHSRLAGLIRDRGMLIAALLGNIVTSFSWFGVNLLGIGLHTYGFMEGAFKWLLLFIASQLLLIPLAFRGRARADAGALSRPLSKTSGG
jgi:ABC-type transport system involved in cytochrome c biogenesis permease subunit